METDIRRILTSDKSVLLKNSENNELNKKQEYSEKKINNNKKKKMKKKKRCNNCNKKMINIVFDCKCGNNFCSKCRYPIEHSCSFDWKTKEKEEIKINNPKIDSNKIINKL